MELKDNPKYLLQKAIDITAVNREQGCEIYGDGLDELDDILHKIKEILNK